MKILTRYGVLFFEGSILLKFFFGRNVLNIVNQTNPQIYASKPCFTLFLNPPNPFHPYQKTELIKNNLSIPRSRVRPLCEDQWLNPVIVSLN